MLETEMPRAFWICETGIREKRAVRCKRIWGGGGNAKNLLYQMESLITGIILQQLSSCYMLRKGQLERPILYALQRDAVWNPPKS
jgi:hypothetical protein